MSWKQRTTSCKQKFSNCIFLTKNRSPEIAFNIGDKVILLTLHHKNLRARVINGWLSFFLVIMVPTLLLTHILRLLTIHWSYHKLAQHLSHLSCLQTKGFPP